MKIFRTRVQAKGGQFLLPMTIVGTPENVEQVLAEILSWDECKRFTRDDLTLVEEDEVVLDPGGILCILEENKMRFELDGVKFRSYWDKLGGVLDKINSGQNWVNGYLTISQFHHHLYIPTSIVESLKDKLMQLNFSEEADGQVHRQKEMKRQMTADMVLAVPDVEGNFFTGPGAVHLIK